MKVRSATPTATLSNSYTKHDMMNPKTLRIVFMGTPEFAVPSLRRLVAEGYNVVGAVTVPDKPAGRGRHLRESDVKIAARELGVPVLQPEKFRDPAFLDALQALQPDLGIVIAFKMLPEVVWAMPRCFPNTVGRPRSTGPSSTANAKRVSRRSCSTTKSTRGRSSRRSVSPSRRRTTWERSTNG